jgi:hypothetical protein
MKFETVFIVYSETYVLLDEARRGGELRKRFGEEGCGRVIAAITAWETAIAEYGDRLARVELCFWEDGSLSWQAYTTVQWRGEVGETMEPEEP